MKSMLSIKHAQPNSIEFRQGRRRPVKRRTLQEAFENKSVLFSQSGAGPGLRLKEGFFCHCGFFCQMSRLFLNADTADAKACRQYLVCEVVSSQSHQTLRSQRAMSTAWSIPDGACRMHDFTRVTYLNRSNIANGDVQGKKYAILGPFWLLSKVAMKEIKSTTRARYGICDNSSDRSNEP
jgi:hypothetical protein